MAAGRERRSDSLLLLAVFLTIVGVVSLQPFQASSRASSPVATYSRGLLRVTIPYDALHTAGGQFTVEVLDPEDQVLGRTEQRVEVTARNGHLQSEVKLEKPLAVDDLVWHRVRYRFEYDDAKKPAVEGTESISSILRRPVVHILGQQSYITGGQAAVRVIVTDTKDEAIAGRGSVKIELLGADDNPVEAKPRILFAGRLNHRGTTEAQFRFPAGLIGSYRLRYVADTPIGSTEFTQDVRLEDKVSILLTSEKPLYQPGQTIHVRALSLDRSDHQAAAKRTLTFEVDPEIASVARPVQLEVRKR
jgi:hypothetical protein